MTDGLYGLKIRRHIGDEGGFIFEKGKNGKDYRLAIADVTRCMTREQLADFVVSTLDEYEVSAAH